MLLALLLVLAVLVAACGEGDQGGTPETDAPTDDGDDGDDGEDGDDEPTDEPEPTEEPMAGGTLRVGVIDDPAHFDPYHITFGKMPYDLTLSDTLAKFDANLELQPRMATGWEIADDNASMTVEVREGMVFPSGGEVTAEVVAGNFMKAKDPEVGHTMLSPAAPVASAEAVDDMTVEVTFSAPTPELSIEDLLNSLPIIDLEADYANEPAGHGPFVMTEWNPGVSLMAEKNPDYWDAENVSLDGVEFLMFDDEDAMAAAYETDEIDFFYNVPPRLAGTMPDGEVVNGFPSSWVRALFINGADPPFDNKVARQALWYAIDRQALADSVFFGLVEPTVLFWPEGSPSYDANALAEHSYDPDRALELFEEAGVNVEEVTGEIVVSTSLEERPQMAQVIQQQLAEIGLNLEIVTHEHATWVERLLATDFTLTVAHAAGGPVPASMTQGGPTRLTNNASFKGEAPPQAYVDAVNATLTAIGDDAMAEAGAQLREAVLDEAFVQPMVGGDIMYAVKPHVQGYTTDTLSQPLFRTVSLSQ